MKKNMMYGSLVLFFAAVSVSFSANANPGMGLSVPPVDKSENLVITDVKVGTGAEAVEDKKLTVHYTGWLYDKKAKNNKGKKIDSSYDRNKTYNFVLGRKQVIDGWDQGLVGMRVGGKRNLVIPSHLGYGLHGAGEMVPPNAKLVFDVELVDVQ